MVKKLSTKINDSPAITCSISSVAILLLLLFGWTGTISKEALAILTTLVFMIYCIALATFIGRFFKKMDSTRIAYSLEGAMAMLGLILLGLFNFGIVYSVWDWIRRSGWLD